MARRSGEGHSLISYATIPEIVAFWKVQSHCYCQIILRRTNYVCADSWSTKICLIKQSLHSLFWLLSQANVMSISRDDICYFDCYLKQMSCQYHMMTYVTLTAISSKCHVNITWWHMLLWLLSQANVMSISHDDICYFDCYLKQMSCQYHMMTYVTLTVISSKCHVNITWWHLLLWLLSQANVMSISHDDICYFDCYLKQMSCQYHMMTYVTLTAISSKCHVNITWWHMLLWLLSQANVMSISHDDICYFDCYLKQMSCQYHMMTYVTLTAISSKCHVNITWWHMLLWLLSQANVMSISHDDICYFDCLRCYLKQMSCQYHMMTYVTLIAISSKCHVNITWWHMLLWLLSQANVMSISHDDICYFDCFLKQMSCQYHMMTYVTLTVISSKCHVNITWWHLLLWLLSQANVMSISHDDICYFDCYLKQMSCQYHMMTYVTLTVISSKCHVNITLWHMLLWLLSQANVMSISHDDICYFDCYLKQMSCQYHMMTSVYFDCYLKQMSCQYHVMTSVYFDCYLKQMSCQYHIMTYVILTAISSKCHVNITWWHMLFWLLSQANVMSISHDDICLLWLLSQANVMSISRDDICYFDCYLKQMSCQYHIMTYVILTVISSKCHVNITWWHMLLWLLSQANVMSISHDDICLLWLLSQANVMSISRDDICLLWHLF